MSVLHQRIFGVGVTRVDSFRGVVDVAVLGRDGTTDAQLMVEMRIGDRCPVVEDDRACSVEVRVGAVALELVGVASGAGCR